MGPATTPSNNSYVRLLEVLNYVKSEAREDNVLLDQLPKLVVIGEESVGKSVLLQCLTNVMFPTDANTCTRVPIWVECRRSPVTSFQIQEKDNNYRTVESNEKLMEAIQEEQVCILDAENVSSSPEYVFFSQTAVTVRISGPDQMDITVVDLPGIKQSGAGVIETRALVEKYYSNPLTFALAVQTINTTAGNNTFNDYIEKYDPLGKRTLKVVTKCDTVGTDDLKAHLSAALNADHNFPTHAVVCAPQGKQYSSAFESELFNSFTELKTSARSDRTTISALRTRMVRKFADLLRASIPGTAKKFRKIEAELKSQLRELGEMAPNVHAVRQKAIDVMRENGEPYLQQETTELCRDFFRLIEKAQSRCVIRSREANNNEGDKNDENEGDQNDENGGDKNDENGHHQNGHQNEGDAGSDSDCDNESDSDCDGGLNFTRVEGIRLPIVYTDEVFKLSQYTPSFFQGESGFARCLDRIVNSLWGVLLQELKDRIDQKFEDGSFFCNKLTGKQYPDSLQEAVRERWSVLWMHCLKRFDSEIENWKSLNCKFAESDYEFEAKIRNGVYMGDQMFKDELFNAFNGKNVNKEEFSKTIDECISRYSSLNTHSPVLLQERLLFKILSECYVSKSRVLKNTLTTLAVRCFLEPFNVWLNDLRADPDFSDCCAEDADITSKRDVVLAQLEKLDNCLKRLSVLVRGRDDTKPVKSGRDKQV